MLQVEHVPGAGLVLWLYQWYLLFPGSSSRELSKHDPGYIYSSHTQTDYESAEKDTRQDQQTYRVVAMAHRIVPLCCGLTAESKNFCPMTLRQDRFIEIT
jgi:hypothetical protein